MKVKLIIAIFSISGLMVCGFKSWSESPKVHIVGEMRNVMWKGQLAGVVNLDTILKKDHLYGLGPVEYLSGEIMIIDGKSYRSTVVSDTEMKVEETYTLKAPFFGYTHIEKWTERQLPDSIRTGKQLEEYIDRVTKSSARPFMFKLSGTVSEATIHIVNLPKGSTVSSPDEAHQGQVNYNLKNVESDIVGFFSTEHQAIFTHHDTFLHMHLITKDRKQMGHLDELLLKSGAATLYLPEM